MEDYHPPSYARSGYGKRGRWRAKPKPQTILSVDYAYNENEVFVGGKVRRYPNNYIAELDHWLLIWVRLCVDPTPVEERVG